jgi:SAM-dependent methyltransferase
MGRSCNSQGEQPRSAGMQPFYGGDLAFIHAAAFETIARGAAGEIVPRLYRSSARIQRVLDVGRGAGPLTAARIDAGFEVTAVDPSAELLELARASAPRAHFVHASVYETEIREYDAVVALGEPLTYHADGVDADNLVSCFFQRVAEGLPAGGMLIFDVIGLGEPSLARRTFSSGDDWAVLVETTENQTGERWLEILRLSVESARLTGEGMRFTECGFSMSRDCVISSLLTGSRPTRPCPLALSNSLLVDTPSSQRH